MPGGASNIPEECITQSNREPAYTSEDLVQFTDVDEEVAHGEATVAFQRLSPMLRTYSGEKHDRRSATLEYYDRTDGSLRFHYLGGFAGSSFNDTFQILLLDDGSADMINSLFGGVPKATLTRAIAIAEADVRWEDVQGRSPYFIGPVWNSSWLACVALDYSNSNPRNSFSQDTRIFVHIDAEKVPRHGVVTET